jgi:hypothetical protein
MNSLVLTYIFLSHGAAYAQGRYTFQKINHVRLADEQNSNILMLLTNINKCNGIRL